MKDNILFQLQRKDKLDRHHHRLHQLKTVSFTNSKEYIFQIVDDTIVTKKIFAIFNAKKKPCDILFIDTIICMA